MKYKNYIFDLYGTLIDIETNEEKHSLWKTLADLYACFGAVYEPKELKKRFKYLDKEARKKTSEQLGVTHSEIKLEKVFLQLYKEKTDESSRKIENEDLFAEMLANTFRVVSRKYLRLFPETLHVLETLKENGCKIYLLSNAQAIFTRPEIHLMGIDKYFDVIYISSDFDVKKPEKIFLQTLMEQESLNPAETVMIGNEMESDVKIAVLCQIDGIFINLLHEDSEAIGKRSEKAGIQQSYTVIEDIGEVLNY